MDQKCDLVPLATDEAKGALLNRDAKVRVTNNARLRTKAIRCRNVCVDFSHAILSPHQPHTETSDLEASHP